MRYLLFFLLTISWAPVVYAQDFVTDVGIFGGKVLKAPAHSTGGLEFGFGWDQNLVTVKVAGDSFESYAVGVGTSLFPGQAAQCAASINCRSSDPYYYLYDEPVSSSKAAEFSGLFSRDLYSIPGGRVTFYASAGGGFIHNSFQVTVPCIDGVIGFCARGTCCTPPNVYAVTMRSWGVLFGTGIRTRVWNGVSIRADLELWRTFAGDASQRPIIYFPEVSSANIPRLTLGVYFRVKGAGWLTH